jgi:hypothetical protein
MGDPLDKIIREVDAFLVGRSPVHVALQRATKAMQESGVEFALGGGLALGAHGYVRVTADVNPIVSAAGLDRFKKDWLGRGFVAKFEGSRSVRETETGVAIDFLVAGEFPGDGTPKPIHFPDPESVAPDDRNMRILDLRTLIELKLASGISAPDRLRDLSDVLELIRANRLGESYVKQLDESVRPKYLELWQTAQIPPRDL